MAETNTHVSPTQAERDSMHQLYREGGAERQTAPHVIYTDPTCPYPGCDEHLQGRGWIHFTIRDKQAIAAENAATLPQLPGDWHQVATIL